jgi:phosphohistidine swiveling domain-containing protein
MLLHPSKQAAKFKDEIGPKTYQLYVLEQHKLRVPSFAFIPSSVIASFFNNGKLDSTKIHALAEDVNSIFPTQKVIVRSSYLYEDAKNDSMAGRFASRVAHDKSEVFDAISHVLRHAQKELKHKINFFSLIIQEFVEADIAGVAFTRNPLVSREMIISYAPGGVTDGRKAINTISRYWHTPESLKDSLVTAEMIEVFKDIEMLFKYPQDIEWCLLKNELHIFQSRPVTTISAAEYKQLLTLDEILPRDELFLFEKNYLTEATPNPSAFTFDLINTIFSNKGPVQRVYHKYGVMYADTRMFRLVMGQLFVDKEAELQSLFPAMSCLYPNKKPRIVGVHGLIRTLSNLTRLKMVGIQTIDISSLIEQLIADITQESAITDSEEAINHFLVVYERIFEINLLVQLYDKQPNNLQFDKQRLLKFMRVFASKTPNWIGNTLEITDRTKFKTVLVSTSANEHELLRELTRWAVVKQIQAVRKKLRRRLSKIEKDPKAVVLPSILTNISTHFNPTKPLGVSKGIARGTLLTVEKLSKQKNAILFVENLSPTLIPLLGKVNGIVAANGSPLSHLAIVAREMKKPIVVNFLLGSSPVKIGEEVQIDGETGLVTKTN